MPSERRGTVTDDVAEYIRRLKGTTEWTGDKEGTIRAPIAKVRWTNLNQLMGAYIQIQLHFPVEDVLKNVKYFLSVVKRATGNLRDPAAKLKGGKSTKPGTSTPRVTNVRLTLLSPVNSITKVVLSTRHGPGIQVADY